MTDTRFFVMWKSHDDVKWPEVIGPFTEEEAERRADTLRSGKNLARVFEPDEW